MNANTAKTVLALAYESVKFSLLCGCCNRFSKNLSVCTADPVLIQRVGPDLWRPLSNQGQRKTIFFSVYIPLVIGGKKKSSMGRAECHNLIFSEILGYLVPVKN